MLITIHGTITQYLTYTYIGVDLVEVDQVAGVVLMIAVEELVAAVAVRPNEVEVLPVPTDHRRGLALINPLRSHQMAMLPSRPSKSLKNYVSIEI